MIRMLLVAATGADYYATNYANYERQNPAAKLEFYLGLIRKNVPARGRVFELGVGMGKFLELAAKEFDCGGADPNAHGVATTQDRVPKSVEVIVGSYQEIPVTPAPEAVVAWDVLEHLPDLDQGLAAIHAKLAPGGSLIAVVPVYDGPLGWLVHLLDKDPTHVSKFSRDAWLSALEANGFEIVERGGILRKLLFNRWYAHLTKPQWLLRPIGTALYFVARKI